MYFTHFPDKGRIHFAKLLFVDKRFSYIRARNSSDKGILQIMALHTRTISRRPIFIYYKNRTSRYIKVQ